MLPPPACEPYSTRFSLLYHRSFLGWSGFETLIRYLDRPDPDQWRKAVAAAGLASMLTPTTEGGFQKYTISAVRGIEDGLRGESALNQVSPPSASPAGTHLARLYLNSPLSFLLSAPLEAANRLDVAAFAAILRIEDHHVQRQEEGYRQQWRKAIQTSNLLQFLPCFEWTSAEAIQAQTVTPVVAMPSTHQPDSDEVAELLTYCDSRCHDLLRDMIGRGSPIPEVGFELQDGQGRVCAEAELAWLDWRIAVVLPERTEAANTFRENGWTVFGPNDNPDNIHT